MNKPLPKIRRQVTCSKCKKIRFVEYWPQDKQDKMDFVWNLANKAYVCSDCG